ncbi:MAG: hypothetical protein IPK19_35275 [Chloroflexi bacterium]|nr:hypothetical protein [Chloroflexota bacterium]
MGNAVLGIGALAGLAATIHGGAVTGRATRAFGQKLATEVPEGEGSISNGALTSIRESAAALAQHSRISTFLMIIALLGMGLARYL